jgi:hypothetical protein
MIIRQILRLIIYYLMPLVLISVFYIVIAKTLFQTKDTIYSSNASSHSFINEEHRSINNNNHIRNNRDIFLNNQTTNQDKRTRKQLRARHKVAKIVLFLCLVFFICWLPKQIHDLYWYTPFLIQTSLLFLSILGLLVYLFIHHIGIIFGKSIKLLL